MTKVLLVLTILIAFSSLVIIPALILRPNAFFPDAKNTPQNPTPTLPPVTKTELTGWFAAWDDEKAYVSLPPVFSHLHTFSPMLYRVMPDSSLGRHVVTSRETMVQLAKEHQTPIAPVITDESDYQRISQLLRNTQKQDAFIQQLVDEAIQEQFVGWSLDIEQVKASDRQAFSELVKNASNALHANNLKLFVIVYGRVEKESYPPARAHDYATIGKYADQVQLMTYGYNNELTGPGGQTPLDWYRSVLTFATETIPREKLLIGLSTHGYDWNEESIDGLTYQEVQARITTNSASVMYNRRNASQVATYTTDQIKHTIFFEDAASLMEKVDIARSEFGINKFAFWRISAEDPKIWEKF